MNAAGSKSIPQGNNHVGDKSKYFGTQNGSTESQYSSNAKSGNKQYFSRQSSNSSTTDDYYTILGVRRSATQADIKKAYKKQAFLHHPDKNKAPDSSRRFAKISTAFDVLSNPSKRSLYDSYGADGVKRSATFYNGATNRQQQDSTRPNGFFFDDASFTRSEGYYHEDQTAHVVYKDPPVYHDLQISLEEILEGTRKKVKITRNVYINEHSSKLEQKLLTIQIKPGWKAGTKIIFEREGDRRPGVLPADIIFVLRDKPHPVFKRNGSDVIFTAKIPLKSALLGDQLMIPLLNRDKKMLKWTDVVSPRSEKRLRGMGLPNSSGARGDLIVRFDIVFPKQLSPDERQLLNCAIPPFYGLDHEDL